MFGIFTKDRAYQQADASTFSNLMKQSSTIVLDVRTKSEFKSGHIKGAKHLDVTSADFISKANKLDKNKHYLVYCRSGMRSADACQRLSKMNIDKLSNLKGGILKWRGKLN